MHGQVRERRELKQAAMELAVLQSLSHPNILKVGGGAGSRVGICGHVSALHRSNTLY